MLSDVRRLRKVPELFSLMALEIIYMDVEVSEN